MRYLLLLSAIVACVSCTGSNSSGTGQKLQPQVAAPAQSPDAYKTCIKEIAAAADETAVDGWFYGQDPRFFKSFYRKIAPETKAEFAMDYHDWLSKFHEDLVRDFKSYVPYSKRAKFATTWWTGKEPRFSKEPIKMQVLWVHESIQDAGELWWRAGEKLNPQSVESAQNLAHDEEQRMLAKFMENENTPGSISDLIWKREHQMN